MAVILNVSEGSVKTMPPGFLNTPDHQTNLDLLQQADTFPIVTGIRPPNAWIVTHLLQTALEGQ